MKRIGWKTCPGPGHTFWVCELFEDGTVGDGLVQMNSEDEAQRCIDSGEADRINEQMAKMSTPRNSPRTR